MTGWQKILIAVDETDTSKRAVQYVCNIAPAIADARICLLHVYPEPPPDFYSQGGTLDSYQRSRREKAEKAIEEDTALLVAAGIDGSAVTSRICMAENKTISQVVLEVQAEGDFGTVVTGKRGVSKAEEFLFGSISNALARHSKGFTSWIVG